MAECPFIDYIIYSLNLFQDGNIDVNKFNLNFLSKCYDHIICVHEFCLKTNERMKIKDYIAELVGKCNWNQHCSSRQLHSTRKREISIKQQNRESIEKEKENVDIFEDLLLSCLHSLHCYLLHDGEELYRLRRDDTNT
eukprot:143665_1